METSENWGESVTACVIMCLPFIKNIIYRMLCFVKTILLRFISYRLISQIHMYFVLGPPNDVKC